MARNRRKLITDALLALATSWVGLASLGLLASGAAGCQRGPSAQEQARLIDAERRAAVAEARAEKLEKELSALRDKLAADHDACDRLKIEAELRKAQEDADAAKRDIRTTPPPALRNVSKYGGPRTGDCQPGDPLCGR